MLRSACAASPPAVIGARSRTESGSMVGLGERAPPYAPRAAETITRGRSCQLRRSEDSDHAGRRGASRNQRPHARVAEVESAPDERPDVDRKHHVAEERVPDANVRRDRAAEIAGQQNGAEDRRRREEVERETRQQQRRRSPA